MKVVTIPEARRMAVQERPDPVAGDGFAVVKVWSAPMCTEYKAFVGGARTEALGHEAAGEVVEVSPGSGLRIRDRVAVMPQTSCGRCALCLAGDYIHCQHPPGPAAPTYAQYVLRQERLLVPIPDGLSYDHGGMACCGLGPTFGALRRMGVQAGDTLLVTGAGPVGLGGVINGVACGARVLVVEGQQYRARLARELGADEVIDPARADAAAHVRELTSGGADAGVDCSGASAARRILVDAVRRRGQVAFVGEGGGLELDVSRDMLRKGLTLHGCWHYNLALAPRLMRLIARLGPVLDRFITHTCDLDGVGEAWALQARGDCGKVVLHPWG